LSGLGLIRPWFVDRVEFQEDQLHVYIDFPRGSKFPCPQCGQLCAIHDSEEAQWRHLNFFQYKCFLHARRPRTTCPEHKTLTVEVPWSRAGSDFTLLFESFVLVLAKQMPMSAVGRIVDEYDTRLWRTIRYYVDKSREKEDFRQTTKVGVDETAASRGHDYVTLFVDLDKRKVVFATPGKDNSTLGAFKQDFEAHHGQPEAITDFSIDMSPAFIKGIAEHFPGAELTFDKFHIIKMANKALSDVFKEERKTRPELKYSRYAWLKNQKNHTAAQATMFADLSRRDLKTAKGYQLKIALQAFYEQPMESAEAYLKKWYFWASHSRLGPFKELAATIKAHWKGTLRYFQSHITNAVLEGINSLVQAAKARARGYRTHENFITMIYLIAGKLDFSWLPQFHS
jgi:transposase